MLSVQFIQQLPVDFSSKETTVATHGLQENYVTFTREELALITKGARLDLKSREDVLKAHLVEKDKEIS